MTKHSSVIVYPVITFWYLITDVQKGTFIHYSGHNTFNWNWQLAEVEAWIK